MKKEVLLEICSIHKLEIEMEATPYGRAIHVILDENKLDSHLEDGKYEDLILWSHVLSDKVLDWLNLDDFSCLIKNENQELIFNFLFNEKWKYNGQYGDKKITPQHLLPHLPEFINQFEKYKDLELREENVFCSFTYDYNSPKKTKIEIHDLWVEEPLEISFEKNFELIEKLENEMEKLINNTFEDLFNLYIYSEDGIEIDIDIPREEKYLYDDLFD